MSYTKLAISATNIIHEHTSKILTQVSIVFCYAMFQPFLKYISRPDIMLTIANTWKTLT